MSEDIEVGVIVDTTEFEQTDREIKQTIAEDHKLLDEVDARSHESFMKVLTMARSAYTIGLGMIKASGVSISYFFRSMMSAAFGAISVLYPLLQTALTTGLATLNPQQVLTATIGLTELGIAVASVMAAQQQESDIARNLRGAAMAIGGISSLIGGAYYL